MRCSEPTPRILVVVVNYRTAVLASRCVRALAAERTALPGLRATVVDNGSGDGSEGHLAAALREDGLDAWVTLMALERNLGFAGGNNRAIAPALRAPDPPAYVVLLNPDAEVRPGALRRLVAFMEAHPEAGIAGSRIEHEDGTPQHSAFRFPNWLGEFARATQTGPVERALARFVVTPERVPDDAGPADWVSGACMIVRRSVFERVGLLDEGYFLYFEETDFCGAAARAGFRCYYVPESRVVHHLAQSTRLNYHREGRRPGYWFESRRRYFVKNRGRAYAIASDLAWLLGHGVARLRRALERRPGNDPPHLLSDFVRHSALFHRA